MRAEIPSWKQRLTILGPASTDTTAAGVSDTSLGSTFDGVKVTLASSTRVATIDDEAMMLDAPNGVGRASANGAETADGTRSAGERSPS